jgi:hypothetical protein
MPTLQKIDQAIQGVPESIKQQIKADLVRAVTTAKGMGTIHVPEPDRRQMRKDVENAPGLSTIERARAIDQLNRHGEIDSALIDKVAIGPVNPVPTPIPASRPDPRYQAEPVAPAIEAFNQRLKAKEGP